MDVPLTPIVVDCVTFDRAPLGRRGYNEDQVDDFLDRVQATLSGQDMLTAADVRAAEFDPAPFIRRGYHEDQVDEFLDVVVEELDRREGNPPARGTPHRPGMAAHSAAPYGTPPGGIPVPQSRQNASHTVIGGPPAGSPAAGQPFAFLPVRQAPPPTPAERTNPMLFAQPPSLPSPSTQPLKREAGASGPPNSSVTASTDKTGGSQETDPGESPVHATSVDVPASVEAGQAASAFRAGSTSEVVDLSAHPARTDRPEPGPQPTSAPDTAPKRATTANSAPADQTPKPAANPALADAAPNPVGLATPASADTTPNPAAAANPALVGPTPSPAGAASPAANPKAAGPTQSPANARPASTPASADPTPKPVAGPAQPADGNEAADEAPALPFPPAPPGEPGYEPGDVARLMKLLTTSPDRDQLANLTFALTKTGGYHTGTVDALRQAWLDALDGPTTQP